MESTGKYKFNLDKILQDGRKKGYDIHIPDYLMVSIVEFIDLYNSNKDLEACTTYGDVRSGINVAEANYDLTSDEADYLRGVF